MNNKKIFLVVALFIISFLLCGKVFAEQINDFQTSVKINSDASINVTEKIFYDFGDNEQHGIYRDIPIKYKRNNLNYNLNISNISVADETGQPYQFTTSHFGNYIKIKIGDPDTTVTGAHEYDISYQINRAINYFSDHDELYWNSTGNDWQVDIAQAEAHVSLPDGANQNKITSDCYFGDVGSQDKCVSSYFSGQLSFSSAKLLVGEGMTIDVGFPKGLVNQPTALQNFIYILQDNWMLVLPIIVLIILFFIWLKFGRDPRDKHPVVAQYDVPDNLTPIEVGTLIDTRADNKDLSAEIIHLAINGYLKIIRQEGTKILGVNVGTDYLLQKLKDSSALTNDFDKQLLDALVPDKERKLSEIKMDPGASGQFQSVKMDVNKKLDDAGYFSVKAKSLKVSLSIIGSALFVVGIFTAIYLSSVEILVSLIGTGIIFIIFGQIMGQRTVKGVEMENYLKGLKLYLGVVEKDRLDFHNAPEKNPQTFEKFLPYAMALGVEKAWAGQFEGIYTQSPTWYSSPGLSTFSVIVFTNDLHSFSSTATVSMAGAQSGGSGAGGGGFSGGGFGGGGGGSW
jgi:Predicted membrane protein